ncbi:alpha/beta fold hydrolase [Saccharicrinis sp. FJH54]|uniref:alpha/beta fold hydrolase n=1 Tax=Saccharicrinis sp. FJH54 TaxID=3344665 RepID=UPI0035D49881
MKLFYRTRGTGSPFVILHGLYGMSDNWMSIVRKMEDEYQFILPDLRNHGRSEFSSNHTYDAMVNDLVELLDDLGLNKIILLGHSMGGKVAMRFALKYPDRISKLIIVDIAPKNYSNATNFGKETANHTDIINTLMSHALEGVSSREDIDALFSKDLPDPNLRSFLLKNIERNKDGKFTWQINLPVLKESLPGILDGFDNVKGENNTDVLFIRGERSPYIHPDDLFYIKKYFPNAELVTVKDAGHWVHVQQPRILINTIRFFLS